MSGFLCNPRGSHCGGEEEGRQIQSAAGGESCITGFFYGAVIQWKLDIRSRSLLVTCYIVPLLFFLLMGGIFTSVMPEMRSTLIQTMIVMNVSMGAFIGLPPSLIETYGSDVK